LTFEINYEENYQNSDLGIPDIDDQEYSDNANFALPADSESSDGGRVHQDEGIFGKTNRDEI